MPRSPHLFAAITAIAVGLLPAQTAPVVLRLSTVDGKPRSGTVQLARYQGEDKPLGPVPTTPGFQPRQFQPADWSEGAVLLRDLPAGHFVFLVTAADHALTCSPPVKVGAEPRDVTVALQSGATLVGQVVDEQGKPIVGATVTSDQAGPELPPSLHAAFVSMVVVTVTRAAAKTDAEGRFELAHLAAGAYTIRAGHADWCPTRLDDLHLSQPGERTELGKMRLRAGARVAGRLVSAGRQKYELELRPTAVDGKEAPPLLGTTWPLADGTFRFPHRVPPGRYRLYGRPITEGSPFGGSDFGSFERELQVEAGQDEVSVPPLAMRN